jgi:hypothetical protein
MWAYNQASLKGRRLLELERTEIWMAVEDFLERYGEPEPSALA